MHLETFFNSKRKMIHQFKRMRQKLISESKTVKYFKYAFGEVLLVVIGILIALGINNWNQKQIAIKKEAVALQSLILDLEEQSDYLEEIIDGEEEFYAAGLYLSEHYAQNKKFILNDAVFSNLNLLGARITFKPVNTTFEELISTGNIGLIRNEILKRKLIRFFNELNRVAEISSSNNTNLVDGLYNPLLFETTVFVHRYDYESNYTKGVFEKITTDQNKIFDSESLIDLKAVAKEIIETPEKALNLFNLIQIRSQLASVQLIKYNELMQDIEDLIKEIQLEL